MSSAQPYFQIQNVGNSGQTLDQRSKQISKFSVPVRSSRPEVFCEKGLLENFTKFTGKHLCQSLFYNKVADLRSATLLKKRLWHKCFSVSFVKYSRTTFLIEYIQWLLRSCLVLFDFITLSVRDCSFFLISFR